MFLLSGLLAVLMNASLQRAFMARRLADRVRALAYAEAGVHEAYSMIATNWAIRTNALAFPVTSYHHGAYDVTVIPVNDAVASIQSIGTCGESEVDVVLDIKNLGSGSSSPGWDFDRTAFDYTMVCGDTLTFSGCGDISTTNGSGARMHSNSDMTITGTAGANLDASSSTLLQVKSASASVDGDVTAPSISVHKKATVTGDENEEAVPLVPIPDIDLTPFYNWAFDHGEVKNGFSLSGSTYTPNGGILWVNGDVYLSSHYQFNGSIIATGGIYLTGQGNLAPTTCAFGAVSRDGPEIRNQSSGKIEGLIYVKNGDYAHTANGEVEGQIIVQGDIRKAGNSDVFLYKQYIPTLPDGSEPTAEEDLVGVSAWQK
jgi:cytoskeletal protein CcmA (bactofilin family)